MHIEPLILVVDADSSTHELARQALEGQPCTLLVARSVPVARRLLAHRPAAVLVADHLTAAPLDELIDDLRLASPFLKILILAEGARPQEEVRALVALGSVLVKPLEREKLATLLRSLVRLHAMKSGVRAMKGRRPSGTMPTPASSSKRGDPKR